eukprot:12093880-Alexandrium_andersonii.AAC.1
MSPNVPVSQGPTVPTSPYPRERRAVPWQRVVRSSSAVPLRQNLGAHGSSQHAGRAAHTFY